MKSAPNPSAVAECFVSAMPADFLDKSPLLRPVLTASMILAAQRVGSNDGIVRINNPGAVSHEVRRDFLRIAEGVNDHRLNAIERESRGTRQDPRSPIEVGCLAAFNRFWLPAGSPEHGIAKVLSTADQYRIAAKGLRHTLDKLVDHSRRLGLPGGSACCTDESSVIRTLASFLPPDLSGWANASTIFSAIRRNDGFPEALREVGVLIWRGGDTKLRLVDAFALRATGDRSGTRCTHCGMTDPGELVSPAAVGAAGSDRLAHVHRECHLYVRVYAPRMRARPLTATPDTPPATDIKTPDKWDAFIAELGKGLDVRTACSTAGIGKSQAYAKRKSDKAFAAKWDAAAASAREQRADVTEMVRAA